MSQALHQRAERDMWSRINFQILSFYYTFFYGRVNRDKSSILYAKQFSKNWNQQNNRKWRKVKTFYPGF